MTTQKDFSSRGESRGGGPECAGELVANDRVVRVGHTEKVTFQQREKEAKTLRWGRGWQVNTGGAGTATVGETKAVTVKEEVGGASTTGPGVRGASGTFCDGRPVRQQRCLTWQLPVSCGYLSP